MRTLNWKYHLGLVSLDVELADRTLSLSVSPVHAAIILHFQTKSECCGAPVCASMGGNATFLGQLEALRALAGGPRPGAWVWISHRISSTQQGHSSAPLCLLLAVPPLHYPASCQAWVWKCPVLLSDLHGLCRHLDADRAE